MFRNKLMYLMPYLESDGAGGGSASDGGASGSGDSGQGEAGKGGKSAEGEKKYSDADVDAIIDKKFAIWKAEQEKKEAAAKKAADEAAKLAEMNATEKANYERDQALKKAEEIESRLNRYDMTAIARGILAEKSINLSDDLLSNLVATDADTTKSNIDSFITLFNAAVDAEVKERLKGKTPSAGTGKAAITRDEIMAIKDPIERQKAMMNNKQLFGL